MKKDIKSTEREREKSAGLCGESVFKRKAQGSEMRVRDLLVLK